MAMVIAKPPFGLLADDQGKVENGLAGCETASPGKSPLYESSPNINSFDSESDEEVKVKGKKNKKLNRSANIISDESDSDSLTQVKSEGNSRKIKLNDEESSSPEKEILSMSTEVGKLQKKRRKIIAFDDTDESDGGATMSVLESENLRGSRRKEKEKLVKKSERGHAMENLLMSRNRKIPKLPITDGAEGFKEKSLNSTDDAFSDEKVIAMRNGLDSCIANKFSIKNSDNSEVENVTLNREQKDNDSSQEFSDSESDIEDNDEVIKKTYGTRGKTAPVWNESNSDENEQEQKLKTEKILENRDLFDADSEKSEEEDNANEFTADKNNKKNQKKKSHRPKKPKKSDIMEKQSCQQKLLRNRQIHLPEHKPAEVSIKNFLQRVPIATKEKGNKIRMKSQPQKHKETKSHIESDVPKNSLKLNKLQKLLSLSATKVPAKLADIDFEFEIEDPKQQAPIEMESLIQRLEKHTALPKQKAKKPCLTPQCIEEQPSQATKAVINVEKILQSTETPGSRLRELKSQLQEKMRTVREVHRKEAEIRYKLENEEFDDDEEEEWEGEEDTDEDDSNNDVEELSEAGDDEKSEKALENNESEEECDDEELQKWNEEENRKQLEKNEDDGQDSVVHANTSSKLQHSIDESTMASARTGCSSVDLFHEEDESKHDSCFSLELRETVQWEETSTIPSGQGDAVTFDGKGRVEANTPFTKLFNGRSRYHSYSNDHSKMSAETPTSDNEDANVSKYDDDAESGEELRLALDENSQFSQVLDTQGYFNPRRLASKGKSKPAKNEPPSMTQLLGLCSGAFEKPKGKQMSLADDFGLPTDLPADDDAEGKDSSQFVLGLCSGKFCEQPAKESRPAKPASVLAKLLGQEETQGAESQALADLCSGEFSSTSANRIVSEPVLEESQSGVSLMKHFGEPRIDSSSLKSFDEIFKSQKDKDNALERIAFDGQDDASRVVNEELIDLCTGKFASQHVPSDGNSFISEPYNEVKGSEDDASVDHTVRKHNAEVLVEDTNDVRLKGDTDVEDSANEAVEEDSEDDDKEDDVIEEGCKTDEENEELNEYYREVLPSKKFSKKQFYEEEAELSGSDIGDDEEDLGSEFDEYESDSDLEDLPSEEKLKAQVRRAHMKATLADDRQDIRIIQERFYEDGDLMSDGLGRRRNFRWRNIDRPMTDTVKSDDSDLEDIGDVEAGSERETQKRIERLEREAFLEEQRKSQETLTLDESSQSILNIINDRRSLANEEEVVTSSNSKQLVTFKRQGSFLDRNKSTLTRLSSLTSKHSKQAAGPTRSFVFQANPSNTSSDTTSSTKKIHRAASMSELPEPKRVKMDRTLSNPLRSSIFIHL